MQDMCVCFFCSQFASESEGNLLELATSSGLEKVGLICVLWGISLPVLQAQPVRVLARQDAEKLKTRQVIYQDRVVPFNTLARDFTLKLCGNSSYQGLTPEQVVASWLLYPEEWQHEPMFYVKSEIFVRCYI